MDSLLESRIMFDWMKRASKKEVAPLDLNLLRERPKTRALIEQARCEAAMAEVDLRRTVGSIRDVRHPGSLEAEITSAVSTASFEITTRALRAIGKEHYLPGFDIPHDAPAVVAFLMVVGSALSGIIRDEGHASPPEAIINAAGLLFMMHANEQKVAVVEKGVRTFNNLIKSDLPNVVDWRENMDKFARLYVMVLSGHTSDFNMEQVDKLFGSMLNTLVGAVES
jgi:hypothetical protein